MTSCLESLRQLFEDIEVLEKATSAVMIESESVLEKDKSFIDNRIYLLGEQISIRCKRSREICDDIDQSKQVV